MTAWLEVIDMYPGSDGFRALYVANKAKDRLFRWRKKALTLDDRKWMVGNSRTLPEVLLVMTRDDDESVRALIPMAKKVTEEALWVLTADSAAEVRANIPKSKKVTVEILEKLASDRADSVKAAVARCSQTPVHVLEKLASARHVETVWGVYSHPSTPPDIKAALAPILQRVLANKWRDLPAPLYQAHLTKQ